jgi:hypothetical protein
MAGKNPKVPWWENMRPAEFSEWAEDDPGSFQDYLDRKLDEYKAVQSQLQPGEANPLEFEHGTDDPRYQSRMRIWENEVALDRAEAKRQAAQSSPQPIPRELKALMEGSPEEKARAVEVTKLKALIEDQVVKANRADSMGRSAEAWDFRDRAAMLAREVERLEAQEYNFEIEQKQNDLSGAETALTEAMSWTPEQVRERRDHLAGLVQGFRDMSETEYSFLIDGDKVVKVKHPEVPACQLESRIGTSRSDVLIRKLGVHGIEGQKEEVPAEEKGLPPMSEMTEGEFQKYQEEAQAKQKPSDPISKKIAPGLLPPR